ncbi:MAG TPA: hypothetical protein PK156_22640, partial [Polyangium sp.]|nr:hypothetical protein [Polyangium sp.]
GKTVWIESLDGMTVSHNFWVGAVPADWTNGSGMGDVLGDPMLFQTPGYEAASYRLGDKSTARNAALGLSPAVTEDFEGRSRSVMGSENADIGAMEYGDPSLPCEFDKLWQ